MQPAIFQDPPALGMASSRRPWLLALAAIPLLLGCPKSSPPVDATAPGSAPTLSGADPAKPAPIASGADPAAPSPVVTITARPVASPGRKGDHMVPITIANHGRRPVRLLRPLRLERDDGGRFVDLSASGEVSDIWIRTDCAPRDGVIFWAGGDRECVDLAPGATIEVPPWLGMVGDAQCACDKCVTAPGGRYRFSARSCEGDARFEGEPFEFHPSP